MISVSKDASFAAPRRAAVSAYLARVLLHVVFDPWAVPAGVASHSVAGPTHSAALLKYEKSNGIRSSLA